MNRGQTVVIRVPDSKFYGLNGVIAGFNPLFHWSVRVKFYSPPYDTSAGYWFSKNEISVVKD